MGSFGGIYFNSFNSNIDIDYYWVKSVKKTTIIRSKFMNDRVKKIYENLDISQYI